MSKREALEQALREWGGPFPEEGAAKTRGECSFLASFQPGERHWLVATGDGELRVTLTLPQSEAAVVEELVRYVQTPIRVTIRPA